MKTIQQLYTELGLNPANTKTAAATTKEDAVVDFLKKIAESDVNQAPDPVGSQQVPVNLGDAAANRPNGTSDNSQALGAFNSRSEKPVAVDQSSKTTSQLPIMEGGIESHRLGEVQNQAPAQAVASNPNDENHKEALARQVATILQGYAQPAKTASADVDLDTVFKVAYINDYLGRQAAQAAMMKAAQEAPMAPAGDLPPQAAASDPTEEVLALLGQVSAEDLVAKKDALLSAIADVLEGEGESEGEGEAKPEGSDEGEAKEAAAKLLSIVQKNPAMKQKIASLMGR